MTIASPGARIAHQLESEQIEGDAFRGDHVLHARGRLPDPEADRTNREWITERHHRVSRNERHRRVGALATLVDPGHRFEDRIRVELNLVGTCKLACENVEEDLGIRLGVHVPELLAKHLLPELPGVDQVSVVCERYPVGRIDVEGLRFVGRFASRRGITDVSDPHGASERIHVVRLEHVPHHAVCLALVDGAAAGHDAGRVLPAMLQGGQRVNQILADVRSTDDSDDPAHLCRIPWTG